MTVKTEGQISFDSLSDKRRHGIAWVFSVLRLLLPEVCLRVGLINVTPGEGLWLASRQGFLSSSA